VSALRPWLGNLALIDLTGEPHFRICGTSLHVRFGGEMTGKALDALNEAHGPVELRSCIEKARRTLRPVSATHRVSANHEPTVFHELYLPLGTDGIVPDTVLLVSYAEARR
jgi:hypothetical protein